MTRSLFILVPIFAAVTGSLCQVQEFYVRPNQTDATYPAQDSHFVAYNSAAPNGKLLLFIGGTFSSPKDYEYISQYAAGLGFAVINVTYPNSVLTTLLAGSSDSLAFDKFRQEICFGTQASSAVNVDSFNSIYTRTLRLIQYLSQLSSHNWSQYLATPSTLDWSKIVVSGHSQGAGHACYLAKKFLVERVVMFSGPNDYSTYFTSAAPWLRQSGMTATDKHFVFLHLQDEIVPFEHQFANIAGIGMLQQDDTTLIDNIPAPYSNSHCLYSNHTPGSSGNHHSSTVIYSATPLDGNNNPLFIPVWEYLLSGQQATGTGNMDDAAKRIFVYPNPAASLITFEVENSMDEIFILNVFGQTLLHENAVFGKTQIDIGSLPPGIYFIRSGTVTATIIKE